MNGMVSTAKGLIPRADLTCEDIVTENAVAVYFAREWFHGGEMVRRDEFVDVKCFAPAAKAQEGRFDGG